MYSLINRLAWIVSLCGGFVIYLFLLWKGAAAVWVSPVRGCVISVGLGLAVKGIFLSENFLQHSLKWRAWVEERVVEVKEREIGVEERVVEDGENEKSPSDRCPTYRDQARSGLPQEEVLSPFDAGEELPESAFVLAFKSFFKTNLLAKIGAILIFLGVVFLLSLVWEKIPSVGKIAIWFFIGFAVYFTGMFLHRKDLKGEAMILFGTGILVNFLVILGGRYLLSGIDEGSAVSFTPFLSSSLTFILLVLNTLWGVWTALKYQSRTLLLFWFLFAYVNPFLTGESASSPYFLLCYSLLISFGGFVIGRKQKSLFLPLANFVLGSLLCCVAPFDTEWGRIAKLACVTLLSVVTLSLFSYHQVKRREVYLTTLVTYVFLVILAWVLYARLHGDLSILALVILALVVFGIGGYLYYLTKKPELPQLYSIGTLGSILVLLPFVDFSLSPSVSLYATLSVGVLALFLLAYSIFPLLQAHLLKKNSANLVFGWVIATLFVVIELYQYGQEYLTTSQVGWCFMALALLFACLTFWVFQRYQKATSSAEKHESLENSLYLYGATAIAVFSCGIALIFQDFVSVVSIIWLCEATILFFLASKIPHLKLYVLGIVLFFIGILKTYGILALAEPGAYALLIPRGIITISLFLNLRFLGQASGAVKSYSPLHDLVHLAGMGMMISLFWNILPSWGERNIFFLACFLVGIGGLYQMGATAFVKSCFVAGMLFFMGFHISLYPDMQQRLPHYLTTALLFALTVFWHKRSAGQPLLKHVLNTVLAVYLLLIGSYYVYDLFPTTFAITIFRWVISVILLVVGISNDRLTQRTLWIYVLMLVLLKIFCFDLRRGLDDALSRVLVFIILGSLLIFVSTRYTKRYGNNLIGEFDIKNLYR